MKVQIKNNYQLIKETMDTNLKTIRSMVEQADNLNQIVQSLNGEKLEQKDQIITILDDINNNIYNLAVQTGELFDLYIDELKT